MSHWFERLQKEVINADLCTRCGSCVGVCTTKAIRFDDVLGECLPRLVQACDDCDGRCYFGCSGREVSFPALNDFTHGMQPDNPLIGAHGPMYVGYATDPNIRMRAASGGVITALLKLLLDEEMVTAVLALGTVPEEPLRPVPLVIRDPDDLRLTQQSKYSLAPTNTVLQDIVNVEGPLAYVGLPCQVHSIRKLQMAGHPEALKIKYLLGSYCGNALYFEAIRSYLRSEGVKDPGEVEDLQYRAGEWPGFLQVKLRDGREYRLKKFYANYLTPFFIVDRCLVCTDHSNEFADVSAADAWAPRYEERGQGWSLVYGRTPAGIELVERGRAAGVLELQDMDVDQALDMHSHMTDFKKRGAFIRMKHLAISGRPVPEYGYRPKEIPKKRRMLEAAIHGVFRVGRSRIARWLLPFVPPAMIGIVFEKLRWQWKLITKRTKRADLWDTEFVYTEQREPVEAPHLVDTERSRPDNVQG